MEFVADALGRLEALRSLAEYRHEQSVSAIAVEIAFLLQMDEEQRSMIGLAGLLHDVGKLVLPDTVLNKPGSLSNPEDEMTKMHCRLGYQILRGSNRTDLELAAKVALHHHERADGTGYPDGLHLNEIPLEARIVTVADVYSALREPRAYKPGLSHTDTLHIMLNGDERLRPQHLDSEIMRVMMAASFQLSTVYSRITA